MRQIRLPPNFLFPSNFQTLLRSDAYVPWIHARLIFCFQLPDNVKSVIVLETCIKSALVVAFAENNTIGVVHALGILCTTRSFLFRDQNHPWVLGPIW
jgi:hypothetical protein